MKHKRSFIIYFIFSCVLLFSGAVVTRVTEANEHCPSVLLSSQEVLAQGENPNVLRSISQWAIAMGS